MEETVPLAYDGTFSYLGMNGENFEQVERRLELREGLTAPVEKGQQAGVLRYTLDGKELGTRPVVAARAVEKAGITDCLRGVWRQFFLAA